MATYLVVEKVFGKDAMLPVALAATKYVDAVIEAETRFFNPDYEISRLYRLDESGLIESAKVFSRVKDEPKDELCAHCGEAIERRDGEVVSKYGNDAQCDASPNDNHRFR